MKCVYWTEVVDSDQEYLLKNVKNLRGHILEKYKLNVIIIMFLKEVTYAYKFEKKLFYQKHNESSKVVKY